MIGRTGRFENPRPAITTIPCLALLPWYVARESLADGTVQPVLADHSLPAQEVHAVFPSPKLVPLKVTSFSGFLQQALAGDWWRQAM